MTAFATYFNSLAGVSATTTTAASVTNLTGVNLFISMLQQAAYTAGERWLSFLLVVEHFFDRGGHRLRCWRNVSPKFECRIDVPWPRDDYRRGQR